MALGWQMMEDAPDIGVAKDEWEDGVDPASPHLGALGITAAQSDNLWKQWQALSNAGAGTKYPATMNLIGALIKQGKVIDAQANLNSVRNWVARDNAQGSITTGTSWLDNLPWKKILVGVGVAALLYWALTRKKE